MRQYIICDLNDSDSVIFSQVNQSSAQTARRNLPNTKFLLSYSVTPSFITNGSLVPLQGPMSQSECLEIMSSSEWSEFMPE